MALDVAGSNPVIHPNFRPARVILPRGLFLCPRAPSGGSPGSLGPSVPGSGLGPTEEPFQLPAAGPTRRRFWARTEDSPRRHRDTGEENGKVGEQEVTGERTPLWLSGAEASPHEVPPLARPGSSPVRCASPPGRGLRTRPQCAFSTDSRGGPSPRARSLELRRARAAWWHARGDQRRTRRRESRSKPTCPALASSSQTSSTWSAPGAPAPTSGSSAPASASSVAAGVSSWIPSPVTRNS